MDKIARQLQNLGIYLRRNGVVTIITNACKCTIDHNEKLKSCIITAPSGTVYNLTGVSQVTKKKLR